MPNRRVRVESVRPSFIKGGIEADIIALCDRGTVTLMADEREPRWVIWGEDLNVWAEDTLHDAILNSDLVGAIETEVNAAARKAGLFPS